MERPELRDHLADEPELIIVMPDLIRHPPSSKFDA